MTPKQFKAARRKLGLSQSALAQALGVKSDRTIRRWEAGTQDIPGAAILAVKYLLEHGVPGTGAESVTTALGISGAPRPP